jgi:hypothetical protein
MALVLADRVRETTTTTGTGTVTLLGAFTGYQSFAAVGNGNTTYYTIAHQTLSEWEVGIGTYTSSGTTLSRTTVLSSSNAGSLVNFSAGTKDVFVTYPSSRSIYADGTTLTATNSSVLPVASGGTGLSTTPANGALNIGNGTGFTRATLTQGTGISITNGAGSITIASSVTPVTSVTGTAPVVSSGGTTPAISMAAATTSVPGYLTAADWTTFNNKGSGSVTSVAQSFTGGIISVGGSPVTTSGTLALTVAGTSGGIPYFSSATTWATSAALAANSIVLGGGAGVAPATTTTGTGVVTALGVNTGTAGAFVVNGGVLGTPSSGTLTNCTFPTLNQNTTGTAANVTGTVAVANGGTGLTTAPTNGQIDIGNGTGFTRAALTAGTGISITNGAGSISIATTGGGTVTSVGGTGTVNGITLSGTVTTSGNLTLGGTLSGVSLTTQVSGTLPVANGGTGVTTSTGSGNNVLSTSPTLTTPTINSAQVATITGSTPLYLARAWVFFNGSNGSIFASGNVSSVTRNGTGNYTVNYSTAMPDTSYASVASCSGQGSVNGSTNCMLVNASAGGTNVTPTTTTTALFCYHSGNQVAQDTTFITFATFR